MSALKTVSLVAVFLALAGCSHTGTQTGLERPDAAEFGKASYYGRKFQSKKTASGEPYDGALKTAAHRRLPFGTKVKVTNIENGRSVTVRINDRGPFVSGRIVDLSESAFRRIADLSSGVVDVKVEVVE